MCKILNWTILAIILVLITGCSSVKVGNKYNNMKVSESAGTPLGSIVSANSGCYMLAFIPIVTGDSLNPDGLHYFSDKVLVGEAFEALVKKSKEMGATETLDVSSDVTWEPMLPFGFCIFWEKYVQVSGNAIK